MPCRQKTKEQLDKKIGIKQAAIDFHNSDFQRRCYLGNCAPLVQHLFGKKQRSYTRKSVRQFFISKPAAFPLRNQQGIKSIYDVQVDHIWPQSYGGPNHPFNFFLIPTAGNMNQVFNNKFADAKIVFIGRHNAKTLQRFLTWLRDEYSSKINLSAFLNTEATKH